MTTRRVLTRFKTKKPDSHLVGKEPSPADRKPSTHRMEWADDEKTLVDVSATSLNKSYPQDHEASTRKTNKRKVANGDNTCKQRQTLSERSVNSARPLSVCAGARGEKGPESSGSGGCWTDSPILLDTPRESRPDTEAISQDEISELDQQATLEEMMCEATIRAAVQPLMNERRSAGHTPYCPCRFQADSSMDTDNDREAPGRGSEPLPRGVLDIDRDANTLDTSRYFNDVMDYLRLKERQAPLPPNFLETSYDVTPKMRGVLMDWLIQVQAHEGLEEETLHVCVALIDRYLGLVRVQMPRLQLVGVTCLLIATKYLERFAPEISTLCYLTANSFKYSQVIRSEKQVLMVLGFDLSHPVPITFLGRYLQVHGAHQPPEVSSLAHYLLDLSITCARLASVLPSILAASAVYLARRLVLGSGKAWTPALIYYTSGYTPADLCDTINELAGLVYKASTSRFQGARNKYNTEQHYFISHAQVTDPKTVETHLMAQVSSV